MFELDEDWCPAGPEELCLHESLFEEGGEAAVGGGTRKSKKARSKAKSGASNVHSVDNEPLTVKTSAFSSHAPTVVLPGEQQKRKRKRRPKEATSSPDSPQQQEDEKMLARSRRCKRTKPDLREATLMHVSETSTEQSALVKTSTKDVKRKGEGKKVVRSDYEWQNSIKEPQRIGSHVDYDGTTRKTSVSSLHSRMTRRMEGARFRWINEQLYTTTGKEASKLFRKDPKLYTVYHQGFAAQVDKWPINPLDRMIAYVRTLPTRTVIADFGCGTAKLAQSVPHVVHSFDLVASSDLVVACDMARTPLPNSSVDVAIFCLSLMGTNIGDFIAEAARVLKELGTLKICEVASRFDSSDAFVLDLKGSGFELTSKEVLSKMFVDFEFRLVRKAAGIADIHLKPCLYKKR